MVNVSPTPPPYQRPERMSIAAFNYFKGIDNSVDSGNVGLRGKKGTYENKD